MLRVDPSAAWLLCLCSRRVAMVTSKSVSLFASRLFERRLTKLLRKYPRAYMSAGH
jgi:hypothetical protein